MRFILISSLVLTGAAFASAQIVTSFEAPGFTTGEVMGQQGWQDTTPFGVVNNLALDGVQSLKFNGPSTGLAWKDLPTAITGSVHSEVSIYMDSTGSTDRFFGLRLESGDVFEGFGLGASISPTGSIFVGSDAPFNLTPIGTLAGAATNRWINISLDYTTGASTGKAKVDGQSFTVTGIGVINSVITADLYADYKVDFNSNGIGYFDKYSNGSAVPEPAPASLFALVGVTAVMIRRRK